MPAQILQRMGQGAFTGYVADSSAYFQSGELEGVLYPNALLLRGPSGIATRAHALVVEALTGHPDMFQTATADAQEIERQIQRVWSTYRLDPVAHAMASATSYVAIDPDTQSLSTRQLLARLLETVSLLVTKEVELARAELKADVKTELDMVKLLVAAGTVALFGVNMLLVAAVFALTVWIPGWVAALAVAVVLIVIGAVLALVGWQRRVSAPMAVTRQIVKEDVQWAKERLA